jgi:hypothetical protein
MKVSLSVLLILILAFSFLYSNVFAGAMGWEAEDAIVINLPLQIFEDKNASNGKYISTPTSNQGSVEYEFEVPVDGTYFMWARHLSIDAGRNSYHLVIDDPKMPGDDSLVWDTILEPQPQKLGEVVDIENKDKYTNDWEWIRVFGRIEAKFNLLTIRTFTLKKGNHRMYLWGREQDTKVDCFCLTDRFDEQPVFPKESTRLAVNLKGKHATTWGKLKGEQ